MYSGDSFNNNVNNNVMDFRKPTVPTKPEHLKTTNIPRNAKFVGADQLTPRGWQRQNKFLFNQITDQNAGDKSSDIDQRFKVGWGPAPRVIPKERSEILRNESADGSIAGDKAHKRQKEAPIMQRSRAHTDYGGSDASAKINAALNAQLTAVGMGNMEQQPPGFGSLKRMWSQKTRGSDLRNQRQNRQDSCTGHEVAEHSQPTENDDSNKRLSYSSSSSSVNSQLSRSASNASNNSVHHSSFKKKTTTWHFVTATSPTDALPQEKASMDEAGTVKPQRSKEKPFDISLQTPRPFRSFSIDDDHAISPVSISKNLKTFQPSNKTLDEQSHPDQDQDRISQHGPVIEKTEPDHCKTEDHGNLNRTSTKGQQKTRFDAHGNMYTVDLHTGEVTYIEEKRGKHAGVEEENHGAGSRLRRMEAISLEGAVIDVATDNTALHHQQQPHGNFSSEDQPPPLLPRDKYSRSSRSIVPPPLSYISKDRNGRQTSTSSVFRNSRIDSRYRSMESYEHGDVSPSSTVPPPLLPRGEQMMPMSPLDYTPMSGADMTPITRDSKIMGSLASLNSVEEFSYEAMEPAAKDQNIFSYATAVDPAQPKLSVREYHEIDPDPEVAVGVMGHIVVDPGSVPPPPDCEPPTLPPGAKGQRSQTNQVPDSPPPLPPMNTTERKGPKKLNYIEVEIGKGDAASNKAKRKSQNFKTNYTEVIVGQKENGDAKKGKSVKGKLMSMFTSSKHDGYNSEGDPITEASTKNADERTTDFSKERNKLKRLSGRLLRKKKQKSREEANRQSADIEHVTNQSAITESSNAAVGIYSSATNLSTTSSESSRSLTHITSAVYSGSSGDGQANATVDENGKFEAYEDIDGGSSHQATSCGHTGAGRRQSYEPRVTQLPAKLDQKSRSVAELSFETTIAKSYLAPRGEQNMHSRSAESTPVHGYQAQRSGKASPVIAAQRVQSHLHQTTQVARRVLPHDLPQSRPVSEPPSVVRRALDDRSKMPRPDSSPQNQSEYPSLPKVSPLPLTERISGQYNAASTELLSPNFPTDSPPPPPSIDTMPEKPLNIIRPAEAGPPTPMRGLKPDRFKRRRDLSSGSSDVAYSAAQDIPPVTVNDESGKELTKNGHDPIYDFVPDEPVLPIQRARPSSKSKLLESEPLYQVYRNRTLSHASMRVRNQNAANRRRYKSAVSHAATPEKDGYSNWQSDLMTDDAGSTTLWREVPEVVASGKGKNLTNDEMKLQQAQFEVVTSQASYMRSLNILIDHFMRDWAMESEDILPKTKRKQLFSNVEAVQEVEQRFLQEIEQHFWDKLYLTDIAKITAQYARSDFEVYVRYVQNQVYQDRILTEMQRTNDKFSVELTRLESSPFCNKLPLLSFILLPMQRVTRLPLLIAAVVNQADAANDKEAYTSAKQALAVVNKLVKKCNEGARKMQQTEQLAEIASELTFSPKVKTYALVSQSRTLVKKGEMMVTLTQENKKSKISKLHLFLFSDVLLMARKKSFLEAGSNIKYEVIDWAKRAMLFVNESAKSENEISLVLLENCFGKRIELILMPVSQNEMSRWTDALNPQKAEESGDSIYETWDCPQYQCIEPYTAQQPDELTLDVGDVMRVVRKTSDGWLEGERLRDSELGWFPAQSCQEIEDEHVRARNLKNLYRILPAGGVQQE